MFLRTAPGARARWLPGLVLWAALSTVHAAPDDDALDRLLSQVVVVDGPSSTVRYDRLKAAPQALDAYVSQVEAVTRAEYDGWSRDHQMAFLINAYNALTLKLVLTGYPDITSIKELGGWFSTPWKKEFFTLFGEPSTLDHIEHGLLRRDFDEPRIHFAIVCASIGCPMLRTEAYRAERLDTQLDTAARTFLRDATRNRYDPATGTLEISRIFDWFEEDFLRADPSVPAFVARYMAEDEATRKRLSDPARVRFLEYDWSLNSAPAG